MTATSTATRTASSGHTLTADLATLTLTIGGQVETMDSVPDAELDAAAALVGCAVDWARGPLDETTYGLADADADGEPDRLQSSLDAAAEALNEERRQPAPPPPGISRADSGGPPPDSGRASPRGAARRPEPRGVLGWGRGPQRPPTGLCQRVPGRPRGRGSR